MTLVGCSGGPSAPGRRCWRLGRKRPSPFQTHSGPTHSAALRPGFNLRYIVLSFLSFWHQLSAEGLPGQKHVAKRTFARVSRIKGPPLRCEHIAAVIISGIPGSFCTHALRAPIHEMRLVSHGHASIKCPLKSRDAKTLRPSEVSKLREAMDLLIGILRSSCGRMKGRVGGEGSRTRDTL